ncbi:MAG: DEAD/DEAH box helicase [Candidatus Korarchaeota archaeon]|nr:DEAD/DEAH box helicase [Candidatus Korarchaeota archaeon]
MDDYLRRYGRDLAGRIKVEAEPLFTPGEPWDPRLYELGKSLYQAQGDAVMALSRALERYRSALVVGEMGCGKTLIGLAVPYIHSPPDEPATTIVMCPGHLVHKWQREALETVPEAEAYIVRDIGDLMKIAESGESRGPRYVIVSRDRAKLGYAWRPAFIEKRGELRCPACYASVLDRDGVPADYAYLKRNKRWCEACGEPLWCADNARVRRYPIAEYVKKYMRGFFDFLVADEVHELKGGDTAQGNAFGALASACRKTLALTGTLLGGYADDVFFILYRLAPEVMRQDGLGYRDVTAWMAKYGVLERTTRYYPEDNVFSKGKRGRTSVKRRPGVSPQVFSRHLLERTVFLGLEDISRDLPPLREEAIAVDMDEDLAVAYGELEDRLGDAVRAALAEGSKALLGTYVNALLSYPDRPFDNEPIIHPHTGEVVAEAEERPKDAVYAKERRLVDIVAENLEAGRRVFVYCQYTGKKDVTERLRDILCDEDIYAEVLRQSVRPEQREEWIRSRVEDGVEVVIANPKLVQTGLDLYDFPTLAFYQTGYSIYSLRQASRRSWRIGQDKNVRVYYLYYRPTMQERAMYLMGSKLEAALAIEGRFSEEGLLAMTQGEDMTTALAKALADRLETEGIEEMWLRLGSGGVAAARVHETGTLFTYLGPQSHGVGRVRRRRVAARQNKDVEQLRLPLEGL